MKKILIIDNNDSFTANLEHLIAGFTGIKPDILPYSRITNCDFNIYDLVVISPGPGRPSDYPYYRILMQSGVPVLGICLGMQIMAEYFGGEVGRLAGCIHGRAEKIMFDSQEFEVARYHSLYIKRLTKCFEVICENSNGVPLGIRHKDLPIIGYQFHPESFLTTNGVYFIDYAFKFFNKHHTATV
ncbi:MAG: aminodeoxychorismate/anthranilate synthase component II [Candidatus Zixiibacteriota bacterium]